MLKLTKTDKKSMIVIAEKVKRGKGKGEEQRWLTTVTEINICTYISHIKSNIT